MTVPAQGWVNHECSHFEIWQTDSFPVAGVTYIYIYIFNANNTHMSSAVRMSCLFCLPSFPPFSYSFCQLPHKQLIKQLAMPEGLFVNSHLCSLRLFSWMGIHLRHFRNLTGGKTDPLMQMTTAIKISDVGFLIWRLCIFCTQQLVSSSPDREHQHSSTPSNGIGKQF